jgi:hypothetical protein
VQIPHSEYVADERLFRGGAPSGQRAIAQALQALSPGDEVIDDVKMPGSEVDIVVMRRRDAQQAR